MSEIEEFEKLPSVVEFTSVMAVYYTNFGGYRYKLDDKPCFYLNGMLRMYEELNK